MDVVPITAFIISALTGVIPAGMQVAGASLTALALVLNNLYLAQGHQAHGGGGGGEGCRGEAGGGVGRFREARGGDGGALTRLVANGRGCRGGTTPTAAALLCPPGSRIGCGVLMPAEHGGGPENTLPIAVRVTAT